MEKSIIGYRGYLFKEYAADPVCGQVSQPSDSRQSRTQTQSTLAIQDWTPTDRTNGLLMWLF